jgi:uracil-DNA glycosylase
MLSINFQPASYIEPKDFWADTGETFRSRPGRNYDYGWNIDHTDVVRKRGMDTDFLRDTLCHCHEKAKWEIALPNGTYAVTVSLGDPAFTSTYTLNVEGVSFCNGKILATDTFYESTLTVDVTDSLLTLDVGNTAEKLTRINYLRIIKKGEPALVY